MIRKMHLIAALTMGAISCSSYGQEAESSDGPWLQQISRSSAVAPLNAGATSDCRTSGAL